MADVLWSLAMAVNVYLVVFRRFDADDLQKLEKRYMVGCYGLPFILAFVFLFVKDRARGKMYGNATVSGLFLIVKIRWLTFSSSGVGSPLSGKSSVLPASTLQSGMLSLHL